MEIAHIVVLCKENITSMKKAFKRFLGFIDNNSASPLDDIRNALAKSSRGVIRSKLQQHYQPKKLSTSLQLQLLVKLFG